MRIQTVEEAYGPPQDHGYQVESWGQTTALCDSTLLALGSLTTTGWNPGPILCSSEELVRGYAFGSIPFLCACVLSVPAPQITSQGALEGGIPWAGNGSSAA